MYSEHIPLIVLSNLYNDKVFCSLEEYSRSQNSANLYRLANDAISYGCEHSLFAYISQLIITDDNAVMRTLAAQNKLSPQAERAILSDLMLLTQMFKNCPDSEFFCMGKAPFPFEHSLVPQEILNELKDFYARMGYGKFIYHSAFVYEQGELKPIPSPCPVTLSDLKGYEEEKAVINANITSFLQELPYENMLLYGERGTGKSSTVHAMLNHYYDVGLRLIEVDRQHLEAISHIRTLVRDNPLKFILFIDDLSFGEYDERASYLKAALEGSATSHSDNLLIIATSNRRHIVKETFSDRENAVHASDSMEEQLSLSDRFGITVLFSSTNRTQYLDIVKQLSADQGITMEQAELEAVAERWALTKGGRSPRRAKQLVDLLYAAQQKGEKLIF